MFSNCGSAIILRVRAWITKLFNSLFKSSGTSSSQTNPRVSIEACLISICSWALLSDKFLIISSHSPLGISIAAIDAIALAIYLRTTFEGVTKHASKASLILSLNSLSKFIQKSSYLGSYKISFIYPSCNVD